MKKLIFEGNLDWKGIAHKMELYEADDISDLQPITQAQAVPFVDQNHIVIFKHLDGYYGLPGGSVEEGEKFEEALKREVYEECACEVLDCGLIGYVKDIQLPDNQVKYQLRYWAKVKLLDEPVNDPAGKALVREVVSIEEAIKKLSWGERGEKLLELALKNFTKHY